LVDEGAGGRREAKFADRLDVDYRKEKGAGGVGKTIKATEVRAVD
jgi:hypothetical protein